MLAKIYLTCGEGHSEDIYLNKIGQFANVLFGKAIPRTTPSGDSVVPDMLDIGNVPIITDVDMIESANISSPEKIHRAQQEKNKILYLRPDFEGSFDSQSIHYVLSEIATENHIVIPTISQIEQTRKSVAKFFDIFSKLGFNPDVLTKPKLAERLAKYTLCTGYIPNEIVKALNLALETPKWRRDEKDLHALSGLKCEEINCKNEIVWLLWRVGDHEHHNDVLTGTLITNAHGGMVLIDVNTGVLQYQPLKYPPALGRFPKVSPDGRYIAHLQSVSGEAALIITEIKGADEEHYILPIDFQYIKGIHWNDEKHGHLYTKAGCWNFTRGKFNIKKVECSQNHHTVHKILRLRWLEYSQWVINRNFILILTNGITNGNGAGGWPGTQTLFLFDTKKEELIRLTEWMYGSFVNICYTPSSVL